MKFSERSYANFDLEEFNRQILDKDWVLVDRIIDLDERWDEIFGHIVRIANLMCPKKDFRIKKGPKSFYHGLHL